MALAMKGYSDECEKSLKQDIRETVLFRIEGSSIWVKLHFLGFSTTTSMNILDPSLVYPLKIPSNL